ncbi:hypothetical protein [Yinghuangia sp. YIM S09857]|uniref:hypothetical protein n=1 Tax=Yinghuangia sp. YIM S09857 TaxID=3436929 RepID=UPI003F529853
MPPTSVPATDTANTSDVAPDRPMPTAPGRTGGGARWFARAFRRRAPRPADLIVMLVPTLVLAAAGWHRRWMTDDGLIFTRVVRQIAAGNGPVYSIGERAETSTSTAWQWVLVAFHVVSPLPPAETAVYLGLALSIAGFWIALDATRRLHRSLSGKRFLLPAGALVFVAVPVNWDFLSAGMEMGLVLFWMAVSWALLVTAWAAPVGGMSTRRLLATSFWFGLGPMMRPDLVLTSVVLLAALAVLAGARWRRLVAMAAVAGALPVAYEIFRMGYYGLVFPMPALTKEAGDSLWERGRDYILDYERPYHLWIPALLLLVAAVRGAVLLGRRRDANRTWLLFAAPLVAAFVQTLYLAKVGGDFMHGRLMMPIMFLVLLPLMLVPFDKLSAPLIAAVAAWAVFCAVDLRSEMVTTLSQPRDGQPPANQTWNERLVYVRDTGHKNPVSSQAHIGYLRKSYSLVVRADAAGKRVLYLDYGYGRAYGQPPDFSLPLRPDLPNDVALVIGRLGLGGAIVPLDGMVADLWGLSSTIGSHIEQTDFVAAGHQKLLPPAWNIALYVDPAAFEDVPARLATQESIRAAYRTLGCGKVAELIDSVTEPMSWNRFWNNLTGAYDRTKLRIPSDPIEAERKFCGET